MSNEWSDGEAEFPLPTPLPPPPPALPPPPPPTWESAPAPMPTSPSQPAELGDMLLSIGDIAVYPNCVVTPSGVMPHRGLTWVVRDNSTTTETMPAYAIVLAIMFFLACFLGLLFLLIKERKTQGYIEVSVQSTTGFHVTQIRANSPQHIDFVRQQVDYARSLVHHT